MSPLARQQLISHLACDYSAALLRGGGTAVLTIPPESVSDYCIKLAESMAGHIQSRGDNPTEETGDEHADISPLH